jgi:hypothetical protein
MKLLRLLLQVLEIGTDISNPKQINRGIKFSNNVAFILLASVGFISFSTFILDQPTIIPQKFLFISSFIVTVPLILNFFNYTTLSRLLICVIPHIYVYSVFLIGFGMRQQIDESSMFGIRIYFLCLSAIPFFIFSKNEKYLLFISALPSFISIVFVDQIIEFVHPELYIHSTINFNDYYYYNYRTYIAYMVLSSSIFWLNSSMADYEKENEKLITELKKTNDELHDQKIQLDAQNKNLEAIVYKRTREIQQKSKVIHDIAQTTAHSVRGPIARILGLVEISKINNPKVIEETECITMIETETKSLDIIVRNTTKILEDHQTF